MSQLFTTVFESPFFGITATIFAFWLGSVLSKKLHSPLANPMLLAILLLAGVLTVFRIPLASYQIGSRYISLFLGPVTAVLAVSIYRQRAILKERFLPVVLGCLVGSLTSIGSVYGLCRVFGLDEVITASLLPKSVTTAIAIELSAQRGGLVAITVVSVVFTGIMGAVFAPFLIRLFGVKDPVEAGVALGTSAHAIGTSKALEIGEVEGAMSGVAIGIAGILTVLLFLFL